MSSIDCGEGFCNIDYNVEFIDNDCLEKLIMTAESPNTYYDDYYDACTIYKGVCEDCPGTTEQDCYDANFPTEEGTVGCLKTCVG